MPKLVNKNSHPARVRHPNGGPLRRILPGQVVEADGEYADTLSATPGFETASSDDVKRHEATLDRARTKSAMPGDGSRINAKNAIVPALQEVRMQTIVAPLQRVIGDDAAPHAPESGTVTTRKEAALAGDALDREAFARHDVLGLDSEVVLSADAATNAALVTGTATQEQIHNAQVENARAADVAAKRFIGQTASDEPLGDDRPISGNYANPKYTKGQLEAEVERRNAERDDDERIEVAEPGHKKDYVAALEADDDENQE